MNRSSLLDELARRPLACDGAMGTQLMARGLASGACGMVWNVDRPGDVQAIHKAYRDAGCDLITTNSFGGTPSVLERHHLAARCAELNKAAAQLARAAAGENAWVLGDVGPFGDFLEPMGDTTPEELDGVFRAQIEALIEGGADAILVETMSDPEEAAIAVQAANQCKPGIPIFVTFAFQLNADGAFSTMMGASVEAGVGRAIEVGAHVVGANCGTSLTLDDYISLAARLVEAADGAPVIVQPNAGSPRAKDGLTVYEATPEQMADCASRLMDAGVRIVGGCCGASPEHLAAMAVVIASRTV